MSEHMQQCNKRAMMLNEMMNCRCASCELMRSICTHIEVTRKSLEPFYDIHLKLKVAKGLEESMIKPVKERTHVFLTTRFVAQHNWTGAPGSLYHLKTLHRHEFHVRMWFPVSHDDRDIEFCSKKEDVDKWLALNYTGRKLVNKSCEMMAKELSAAFNASTVEVSEDGENGAIYHRS